MRSLQEFDANRHVVFTGTVTKMMWVNPHAWIYVDVKKARRHDRGVDGRSGDAEHAAAARLHEGIAPAGTMIKVDGYQSKDGSLRANGRDLTLPDGRTLFLGNAEGGPEGAPGAKK
jgi:hypothetical protein